MKFCSPRCKSYAQYRKREGNPALRMKDRARQRDRYVAAPLRSVLCSACGQAFETRKPNRTYCSATCRNHARNDRRRSAETPALREMLLNGLVSVHGAMAPTLHVLKCVQTVGLLVQCPLCDVGMGAATPSLRVCAFCATEARFNDEEVSSAHLVA